MDLKPSGGGKRKGAPLDSARAGRGVWLVKLPQFLASQWAVVPLLQEREAARSRAEPVLVAALVPVLRRARRRAPRCRAALPRRAAGADASAAAGRCTRATSSRPAGRAPTALPPSTRCSRAWRGGCAPRGAAAA
jgi:hypothetical protein